MVQSSPLFTAALCASLVCQACGGVGAATSPDGVEAADSSEDVSLAGPEEDAVDPPPSRTYDFIVSELNFYFPDGLESGGQSVPNPCGTDTPTNNTTYWPLGLEGLEVNGFDLDGNDSQEDGLCPHTDYVSADGQRGIDYGFLHVIDKIRPARPGQTIEVVLSTAPTQGLVKAGIRISGVEDLENDADVDVLVTTTIDTPLLGTDGEIIAGSSVTADSNPAFQSHFKGQIDNGVLLAGPGDIAVGNVNLLVAQERVLSLKDAMIRATVKERPNGAMDVDTVVSGWWRRSDMVEAIGNAVLAIGANPGELDCVLDSHMDHSLDGTTCDAMSMIFRGKAVSGFITGLDEVEAVGGE